MMRGYRDLFYYRDYLFVEDLLTVSRFPRTLTIMLPFALILTVTCVLTIKIV
jgi:hypothetical protein